MSFTIGVIIGGASEDEIERIRIVTRCVGLLFQLLDDILDLTKSSERTGKDLVSLSQADGFGESKEVYWSTRVF
jgi:geranylgeranyl diphosphate synthase type II